MHTFVLGKFGGGFVCLFVCFGRGRKEVGVLFACFLVLLVVLLICNELQSKTVLAFYISHCPPPQQGNSLTVFSLLTLADRDISCVSCSLKPPRTVFFFLILFEKLLLGISFLSSRMFYPGLVVMDSMEPLGVNCSIQSWHGHWLLQLLPFSSLCVILSWSTLWSLEITVLRALTTPY